MSTSKANFSLVVVAVLAACGSDPAGAADAAAGGPPLPPGAPAPAVATPSNDEVTEAFGFFVSEEGRAGARGTRTDPVSSIGAGIALAAPLARRVYVCKGTYREAVTVRDGVSVVGGYDCSDAGAWKRAPGSRSSIAPPAGTSEAAVLAKEIVRVTRIEGFDVTGADVTGSDAIAVGLRAERANALVVADSSIRAGAGADGKAGTTEAPHGPTANGADATAGVYDYDAPIANAYPYPGASPGGAASSCGGGAGGAGGRGGVYKCEASANPNLPPNLVSATRFNSFTNSVVTIGPATLPAVVPPGKPGASGTDGKSADVPGRMVGLSFVRASGERGTDGAPGTGGAGGQPEPPTRACSPGRFTTLANGSGGGAGGCGGRAGGAGEGGGASIGVLSDRSEGLVFDGTSIEGGPGGEGGPGSFGSDPADGGEPGALVAGVPYGFAQRGRPGGRPGVSGNGAGGSSFGLVHLGPSPKLTNGSTAKPGAPGAGVTERMQGYAASDEIGTIPASVAGDARDVVQVF